MGLPYLSVVCHDSSDLYSVFLRGLFCKRDFNFQIALPTVLISMDRF